MVDAPSETEFRFDEDVLAQQSWLGDSQLLGRSQSPVEWSHKSTTPTKERPTVEPIATPPRASLLADDETTNWSKLLRAALSPEAPAPAKKLASSSEAPAPAEKPASTSESPATAEKPASSRDAPAPTRKPTFLEQVRQASAGVGVVRTDPPLERPASPPVEAPAPVVLPVDSSENRALAAAPGPVGSAAAAAPAPGDALPLYKPRICIQVEPLDAESAALMVEAGYSISLTLRIPVSRTRNRLASTYRRLNDRWSKVSESHRLELGYSDWRPGVILYAWGPIDENQDEDCVEPHDFPADAASERVRRLESELLAAREDLEAKRRRVSSSSAEEEEDNQETRQKRRAPPQPQTRRVRSWPNDRPPDSPRSRFAAPPLKPVPEEPAPLSPSQFDSNIALPWDAVDNKEGAQAPAPADHVDPALLSSNLSNVPWFEDESSRS